MGSLSRAKLNLNALRAFESAARHLSFSRAADELHVTHAAISHQVRSLERRLGVRLFERHNPRISLTDEGRVLLVGLTDALERIATTLDSLELRKQGGALAVTCTPAFATKWLVPRLRRFRALHPDIEVHLIPTLDLVDFARDQCHMAVRCGAGEWPGLRVELLMPIDMTPVCSPSLLAGPVPLRTPLDLLRHTLIHADIGGEQRIGEEWRQWFLQAGLSGVDTRNGPSVYDASLAQQAAVDGLGVAMGYLLLAAEDIAAGRLVAPFRTLFRHAWSYYIVHPESLAETPKLRVFCDWLHREAQRHESHPTDIEGASPVPLATGSRATRDNPLSVPAAPGI